MVEQIFCPYEKPVSLLLSWELDIFFFLKWAAFLALKKSYFDWHTIFTMFSNRMHKELRIFSLLILYIGSLRLHFELLPSLKLKKKKKAPSSFLFL